MKQTLPLQKASRRRHRQSRLFKQDKIVKESDKQRGIAKTIERITSSGGDYSLIHEGLKAKRLQWWEENKEEVLQRVNDFIGV